MFGDHYWFEFENIYIKSQRWAQTCIMSIYSRRDMNIKPYLNLIITLLIYFIYILQLLKTCQMCYRCMSKLSNAFPNLRIALITSHQGVRKGCYILMLTPILVSITGFVPTPLQFYSVMLVVYSTNIPVMQRGSYCDHFGVLFFRPCLWPL